MREIVIISGKGGTGKTTFVAALASLLVDIIIVDCDVDASNLHLLLQPRVLTRQDFYSGVEAEIDKDNCTECDICIQNCTYGAISSDYTVNTIDCEGCAVCYYFCPADAITLRNRHSGEWFISQTRYGPMVHARLGIAESNSGKLVSLLRRQARQLAEEKSLQMILIDGSPGIGCPVISSITGASHVVVVTEPTSSGFHDTERVLSLTQHFKIPTSIIINKYDLNESIGEKIERSAKGQGIHILGRIPYNMDVTRAMVLGKTIVEYSNGALVQSIADIADGLIKILK